MGGNKQLNVRDGDTVIVQSDSEQIIVGIIHVSIEEDGAKKILGIVFNDHRYIVFSSKNIVEVIGRPIWTRPMTHSGSTSA